MISNIPGTDTPGIYDTDLSALEWAAQFTATGVDHPSVAELLGPEYSAKVPVQHHYAALTGKATNNTWELLRIIERLAGNARSDAETIKRLRGEVTTAWSTAHKLAG